MTPARPTATVTEPLLSLDDSAARDAARAGTKAATLATLRAAGHRVPEGFVLPVDACRDLAADSSGANMTGRESLRDTLAAALRELGGGPVAVRSSAVEEDQVDASYAGQYETVLGVRDLTRLVDAIGVCIASARSARVATYGTAAGAPGNAHMAVLVQRQLEPDAAGVAFSANPVTGDRDETLVSAVRGTGERLVAGEAAPDEWVVRNDSAACLAAVEDAITAEDAVTVARLAERLEAAAGTPQDVEWALHDGAVHLLQARPITALPVPPDLEMPADGTWTKDAAHYPELLTPFGASVYVEHLDEGTNAMLDTFGLLVERVESVSLGGEVYSRAVPVGGKDGPAPPWWLLGLLARIVPPLRARCRTARQAVDAGLLDSLPERWENEWRAEFQEASARLRRVDLTGLDDDELLSHLDEATALLARGEHVHFQLFVPYMVAVHELAMTCEDLLGWDTAAAMDLVAGLSEASSEPARELAAIADRVRHSETAMEILDAAGPDVVERLDEVDHGIAAPLRDYLDRYGWRPANYDPGAPALAERPGVVASLLRDAARGDGGVGGGALDARRREAEERARRALPRGKDRSRFEEVLERAQRVYPVREDNVFWTDSIPCGLVRRAALEIGRRLTDRGQLRRPTDVSHIHIEELAGGLRDGRDLAPLAARRRAEQAWVEAHPGPALHGPPPQDFPDVRGLPEGARRLNGALIWFMQNEFDTTVPTSTTGDGLTGVPGSPGRYTGPVRVVTGERDFARLQAGEVLVCPITSPVWSVLFSTAGALVTDGGGVLSHAAIIAREHGIPAVLGTGVATAGLRDGQIVTVDGSAGHVSVE